MFGANNKPSYVGAEKIVFLKKGYDIKIKGKASKSVYEGAKVKTFAVQPGNFRGVVPIPKVVVEKGDKVKAGDLLLYDKKKPELKFVSPVSGTVLDVRRGARRSIKEVVVESDAKIEYKKFEVPDVNGSSREQLVEFLLDSGLWSLLRQRPYDFIPEKDTIPKNIIVSTFDSAPLAADMDFVVKGKEKEFQKGLDVLVKLAKNKVFLTLDANKKTAPPDAFLKATGVEKVFFKGPHPSGNVGVQMHHLDPIRGLDKFWYLGVQEVATIGKMFLEGIYDVSRMVAVTGESVSEPKYLNTYLGANIGEAVNSQVKDDKCRIVSGNLLTGEQKGRDEFLNNFDSQISIIPEGDYHTFFGWLVSQKPTPTKWEAFMSNWIKPNATFETDTNTHGQKRAFVHTGIYQRVLPMDIYPVHLMKAILAGDIEQMEGLGINEVAEEDVALCEFICPCKQEFQAILREGHRFMIEQS